MTRQLSFFVVIGTLAAIVHMGMVALLVEGPGLPPLAANVGGFVLAFFVSFGGHARWTFPVSRENRAQARHRFLALAIIGFAANQSAYYLALHFVDQRWYLPTLAMVLVAVAAMTFILSRHWAFAARR